MQRYNAIDCLKGISCIAVILIHFNFSGNYGIIANTLSKFSVPYFFFVSGFFFNWNEIRKKINHVLKLIINAEVFYIVFTILYNLLFFSQNRLFSILEKRITLDYFLRFLIANHPLLYGHLWFMFSLLYIYIFFYFIYIITPPPGSLINLFIIEMFI